MQSKKIDSITTYLLYSAAVIFVLFFLMLSYYNRLCCDDFGNVYYAKGKNLFQYVKLFYDTYGGRWASWAYMYIVFAARDNFQGIPIFIFTYYLVTLFIFIYSGKEIIKVGVNKLFCIVLDNKTSATFSILFLASFYFFTFNNIETWWYVCSSFHYVQGIMFLVLGLALLLRKKIKTIHYLIIAICFIYVGSGFEMYALIVAILLFICVVYLLLKRKNGSWKGLVVAGSSLIISAIISFLGPGNFVRRNYFQENINQFLHPITWNNISGTLLQQKFIIAFIIASAWLILGVKLRNNSSGIVDRKRIKNMFILSIVSVLLSVAIVYFISLFFTYGIMPPARAWTFTSFSIAFFICFSFLLIGYFSPILKHIEYLITFSISIIIVCILTFNLFNQYTYASNYSSKYDAFIDALLVAKSNNQTKPFYMDRLPNSGMLMKLEMTEESSNPTHLKNILGVKFEVIVK